MLKEKRLHERRKERLRYKLRVSNRAGRPRLCIHRTNMHMYAQIMDDTTGSVLVMASTMEKELKDHLKNGGNKAAAEIVGKRLAEKATQKGIEKVVFDRSGFLFHGRVKALADQAKQHGLEF